MNADEAFDEIFGAKQPKHLTAGELRGILAMLWLDGLNTGRAQYRAERAIIPEEVGEYREPTEVIRERLAEKQRQLKAREEFNYDSYSERCLLNDEWDARDLS